MFLKLGLLSKFECFLWPVKSFIAQPGAIVLQNFANNTVLFVTSYNQRLKNEH